MKLAICIGDPNSIGQEIIKSWVEENPSLAAQCEVIAHKEFLDTLPNYVSKFQVGSADFKATLGVPSVEAACIAYQDLEHSAKGASEGIYKAVVTAPVSKAMMNEAGYKFVGQTEFFESKWQGEATMCFVGKKLIVSLVTWHIAFKDVPLAINMQSLSKAVCQVNKLCGKLRDIENPRIAVCALNPHAGENGILGSEEIDYIDPILDELRQSYPNLSKALPADTVFMRCLKGEFDCIVSMYHDQGLAPLKMLEFDQAVNVSMGLEHIRTSPDHGTAYAIAGKGLASNESFSAAVNVALKLC